MGDLTPEQQLNKDKISQELDEFGEEHSLSFGQKVDLLQYMNDNNLHDFESSYRTMTRQLDKDNLGDTIENFLEHASDNEPSEQPQRSYKVTDENYDELVDSVWKDEEPVDGYIR